MKETKKTEIKRNSWGAIEWAEKPQWVKDLQKDCERAGAWSEGIESDKRMRGEAINVDLYSFDETQKLAVVQVRQCIFHPRRWSKVRKDYYLIGRNENGNAFAHPVPSVARYTETVEQGVIKSLCKIWDCKQEQLSGIKRQGDIAFIPVSRIPNGAEEILENHITLRDTHLIEVEKLYSHAGAYYVVGGGKIKHTKRQHKVVKIGKRGIWRIQKGLRSRVWGFSAPTAD